VCVCMFVCLSVCFPRSLACLYFHFSLDTHFRCPQHVTHLSALNLGWEWYTKHAVFTVHNVTVTFRHVQFVYTSSFRPYFYVVVAKGVWLKSARTNGWTSSVVNDLCLELRRHFIIVIIYFAFPARRAQTPHTPTNSLLSLGKRTGPIHGLSSAEVQSRLGLCPQ